MFQIELLSLFTLITVWEQRSTVCCFLELPLPAATSATMHISTCWVGFPAAAHTVLPAGSPFGSDTSPPLRCVPGLHLLQGVSPFCFRLDQMLLRILSYSREYSLAHHLPQDITATHFLGCLSGILEIWKFLESKDLLRFIKKDKNKAPG